MRSGFCSSHFCLKRSIASCGGTGRSYATTSADGSISRMRATVPDCADDMNPWTYIIFLPFIIEGYCNTYLFSFSIFFPGFIFGFRMLPAYTPMSCRTVLSYMCDADYRPLLFIKQR